MTFFKNNSNSNRHLSVSTITSPVPDSARSGGSASCFPFNVSDDEENETATGTAYNIRTKISEEIVQFAPLFDKTSKFFKKFKSNKVFWQSFREKAPMLNQLYLILNNIPSSSAYIERFFSICGVVNKPRASTMTDGLFTCRCMLKTNIKILDELSATNSENNFNLIN
jgi:hypothetical protein